MSALRLTVKLRWHETTPSNPCPSCQRFGWCQIAEEGLSLCRRVAQPGSITRTDKAGAEYHLWRPGGSPINRVALTPPVRQIERVDVHVLDAVYRSLLSRLRLCPHHRAGLRRRGLSDDAIDRRGYRSMPGRERVSAARDLAELYGAAVLRVPGVCLRQETGRPPWPSLTGGAGLLIPVRDLDSRVVALLVRRDDAGVGSRYYSLSSKRHGGPGPGARCHAPVGTPATVGTLRITEGPLKADVAAELSGVPTLGIPGVGMWRASVQPIVQLRPTALLLAWDQDWQSKAEVRRPLVEALRLFVRCGFKVAVETWDATHKGIDDALAAGISPTVRWIGGEG